MLRCTLLLIFLAFKTGGIQANEIKTAQSWDHFREIMISDGMSQAGADEETSGTRPRS
jgi:hypothetical protein